eukprot:CAMPEP_0172028334 /NCGR_PEP_ID=MMETSP1041-20130122/17495_1 /TAXON_ID=464988 /ORGANISM="Hemiselmis andersenii, Strain CCMP439" /LENGTH=68 /DNA_ID=CAMNT_0012684329 /DNA_START=118 /DNA_END=324 /DNA_ORIENTATION=-
MTTSPEADFCPLFLSIDPDPFRPDRGASPLQSELPTTPEPLPWKIDSISLTTSKVAPVREPPKGVEDP